jgi:hypothetical protein
MNHDWWGPMTPSIVICVETISFPMQPPRIRAWRR